VLDRLCLGLTLLFFLVLLVGVLLGKSVSGAEPERIDYGEPTDGEEWTKYYQPGLCGPIALFCVCKHYGISATIDELAQLSEFNGRGVTLAGLVQAAEHKQLQPTALRSGIPHLKQAAGPAIIDWPLGHFCVFLGWSDGQARVLDPPRPIRFVSVAELEKYWGKHIVTFARARSKDAR
jgi:ABC-type bacteriocin/lantibiotic exporter with double-glycine peptidase domain